MLAHDRTPMPANFCLIENYEEVAEFIGSIRHHLTVAGTQLNRMRMEGGVRRNQRRRQRTVENYADFESLDRITPVAALVLVSEYDRAIQTFNAPDWLRAVNVDAWKPNVFTTLEDLGFLALLGVDKHAANVVERNGIYTVPFLSGDKVRGAMIDKLIRSMAELADSSGIQDSEELLNQSRVYDGLGEAIQNVEDHAYPEGSFADYPIARKWWMTGSIEPAKKKFTIAIYDQGVSIPVSLPRWTRFGDFRSAFASVVGTEYDPTAPEYDGATIAQAVQLGRSSTGKAWHGKGLPVIRDIVDNSKGGGKVRIFSRNGEFTCEAGKSATSRSNKTPLVGTLVEWELFL